MLVFDSLEAQLGGSRLFAWVVLLPSVGGREDLRVVLVIEEKDDLRREKDVEEIEGIEMIPRVDDPISMATDQIRLWWKVLVACSTEIQHCPGVL